MRGDEGGFSFIPRVLYLPTYLCFIDDVFFFFFLFIPIFFVLFFFFWKGQDKPDLHVLCTLCIYTPSHLPTYM